MDIQRKNVGRNKAIRWTIIGVVVLAVWASATRRHGGWRVLRDLSPEARGSRCRHVGVVAGHGLRRALRSCHAGFRKRGKRKRFLVRMALSRPKLFTCSVSVVRRGAPREAPASVYNHVCVV